MNHLISSDDQAFKKQVETCTIAVSDFNHRAHIRLAYIYLVESGTEVANNRMRNSLISLLQHNHIEPLSKYHETLTKAWLLAVNHFMKNTIDCGAADEFIDCNPKLLDSQIMLTHYTKDNLFSDKARKRFIKPDLEAIPL